MPKVVKLRVPDGIIQGYRQLQQQYGLWKNLQEFLVWAARQKILEYSKRREIVSVVEGY